MILTVTILSFGIIKFLNNRKQTLDLEKKNLFIAMALLSFYSSHLFMPTRKSALMKSNVTTNINYDTIKFTNGFDFPVGKPNAGILQCSKIHRKQPPRR